MPHDRQPGSGRRDARSSRLGPYVPRGPASGSGTIVPVPARANAAHITHCHVDRSDPGRVRRWL
ncbi:hypothetical protein HPB47_027341, partial [Ixodes persulcatus]